MKTQKPLMGLCPIGKFVFSNDDAVRYKKLIQHKLAQFDVPFVDIDQILPDGLVKDQSQTEQVVKHFKDSGIDCLFVPHCNFGTEGAVGMIAKKLDLPTLLWGPRDEMPMHDGTRLRDTLCGMFASSKVMHKLGVKFTYIENCRIDDHQFESGVDTFLRAANIAKVFRKGMHIGHIGQRIDFFWTTIINESELLERFNIQILPLEMVDFVASVKARVEKYKPDYLRQCGILRKECIIQELDDQPLMNILAVRDEMFDLAQKNDLDGFAIQDFMSLINEMGAYCFFANSLVSERHPIGCESDIHGAISSILLSKANFDTTAVFLSDITIRHPENDNAVLMWHGGAPLSMKHPSDKIMLGHHWILPSPLSGMPHFQLKDGLLTTCRFDGDRGNYKLAIGQGQSIYGPHTLNNYVWMQVDNWPKWERILMEGPFIHHAAMSYGHFGRALLESCKYISGLEPVILGGL